jgi:hypothetical protein
MQETIVILMQRRPVEASSAISGINIVVLDFLKGEMYSVLLP